MTNRFTIDSHEMRSVADLFDLYAQIVQDEALIMSCKAQVDSHDTKGQINQTFHNIVDMLHGVRDGLIRDANIYEQQEQASRQILGS
ncbi:WXG100 family type VII secretion target [Mycobacterium sp.]|uniref:WXG100 family type VII secretion target n=1 Tax=Mycobacterium sp. TaxID=1785 RepID=UPI003C71AF4D